MVDIQSAAAEIKRGKKENKKKKPQDETIMSASAKQGGHDSSSVQNDESLCRQLTVAGRTVRRGRS